MDDENVLELVMTVAKHCKYTKNHNDLYALKWWILLYVNYILIFFFKDGMAYALRYILVKTPKSTTYPRLG